MYPITGSQKVSLLISQIIIITERHSPGGKLDIKGSIYFTAYTISPK